MHLTEHAGKALLEQAGLAVAPGIALGPGEAEIVPPPFPGPYYLKAQVLSGGRGKAGGVVRLESAAEIGPAAQRLFTLPIGGQVAPFLRLEPAVAH
ncbi:MAG TPA: succinyl-CoA synthetase subunit beta, partial [Solidesulfovibrio sp.]|nr:succinyl-CoA synthetase subunit beta [Desulfovibrio sp.]HML61678.1 succinyl-CoA synthetase subunit beta [Solidesulfovibrio sp.]